MDAIEKACLELCEEIFCTFSVTDKTVVNYSVKLSPNKTVEVILVTKEDEYTFVLNLPFKEKVYSEADSHLYHCSKCVSENKYNLKCIQIKGFDVVEFCKIDVQHLRVILEKLAEAHAKCIEEDNLEKKNYKTGIFSVAEINLEPLLDVLERILDEASVQNIDRKIFLEGIKIIEETKLEEDCVFVYGNILQNKLFVKSPGKSLDDYKILNIRTEQTVPLVYDLLLTVFSFTDQNMRQHYFHELLDYYYKSLEEKLRTLYLDIKKCLPLTNFQRQINKFLPCVKLEVLKLLCQAFVRDKDYINGKSRGENLKQHETICTAALEVNQSILYPNLHREDCYTIIRNKVGSSNYVFLDYRLTPLQEREGYLGDYFKLKIDLEYEGEVKLFHLFAKYLPTYNDGAKDLATDSFKKEEFYYLKFIPLLNDLELEDITNFLPNCYLSRTDEVLIFEDMSVINYKTLPVHIPYTYDMLLMTLKQLAKVHASSLLYEELLSKKTNEIVRLDEKYPEYVEEKTILNTKETMVKKAFECATVTFLDMLGVFPEIPKKFSMEEFKKRGKLVFELCYEKVKKSDKFRNVLCQGDCWASNILFKTDEDSLPIDCRLVDYQLTRYCPPAHDIYYLFYMATTKDIRNKFGSKLLQEYYSELSNILQRHKVDLQKIYTYQEFLDCCKYMKSQGLCQAIMIIQFVLYPQEKLKNIFQDKEQVDRLFYVNRDIFIQELQYEGTYGKRMKELAEEMYEICENIFL